MATITLEQWAAHLRSVDLGAAIEQAGIMLALEGQRHAFFGVTNAPGGLRRRTGHLARSIAGTTKRTATHTDVVIKAGGSTDRGVVKYAAIHEHGGTIRSKSGGYLAIPVHPSLKTAAGVTNRPGPRSVTGLEYGETARGQPLLFHGETGEIWFILRRSVKIPARPYMQPALDHTADKATKVISLTIADAIRGDA